MPRFSGGGQPGAARRDRRLLADRVRPAGGEADIALRPLVQRLRAHHTSAQPSIACGIRLGRAAHAATPCNLLAEDVQAPHIAGRSVVAEGALQHSQSLSVLAARLLNDPQGFNRARMRVMARQVIGLLWRRFLTNASQTEA